MTRAELAIAARARTGYDHDRYSVKAKINSAADPWTSASGWRLG